ncbi:putative lipoprotein, partial [Chlamydia psittaci 01DC11]
NFIPSSLSTSQNALIFP